MDRHFEITEDDEADELLLTGEDIETILRALDSYGYAMVMSQSIGELDTLCT